MKRLAFFLLGFLLSVTMLDKLIIFILEPDYVRCDGGEEKKYDIWMWINK